jgi:F0F1-type ATP synthase assembly protein I
MDQVVETVPWWIVVGILLFGLVVIGGLGVVLLASGSLLFVHP